MSSFLTPGLSLHDHKVGTKDPGLVHAHTDVKGHQGTQDAASLLSLLTSPEAPGTLPSTSLVRNMSVVTFPKQ